MSFQLKEVAACVAIVLVAGLLRRLWKNESETARIIDYRGTNYSNPNNNHDAQKFKHDARSGAEAEVRRMKRDGSYQDTNRLNVYYNRELNGWYVGRGQS
jgi:hypothetical protein